MENKHFVKFSDGLMIEVSVPQIKDSEQVADNSHIPFADAKETLDETFDTIVNPMDGYNTAVNDVKKSITESFGNVLNKFAEGVGQTIKTVGKEKMQASSASLELNLGADLSGNLSILSVKTAASVKITFKWDF